MSLFAGATGQRSPSSGTVEPRRWAIALEGITLALVVITLTVTAAQAAEMAMAGHQVKAILTLIRARILICPAIMAGGVMCGV